MARGIHYLNMATISKKQTARARSPEKLVLILRIGAFLVVYTAAVLYTGFHMKDSSIGSICTFAEALTSTRVIASDTLPTGSNGKQQLLDDPNQEAYVVYVDMVADLFHYGHGNFLRQCREYCETKAKELSKPGGCRLMVGLHSDKDVESYKRIPIFTLDERVKSVQQSKFVTGVIPNAPLVASKEFLELHQIDLVMHGDDNSSYESYGPAIDAGKFKTVPYTAGVSTSEILERISKRILSTQK